MKIIKLGNVYAIIFSSWAIFVVKNCTLLLIGKHIYMHVQHWLQTKVDLGRRN